MPHPEVATKCGYLRFPGLAKALEMRDAANVVRGLDPDQKGGHLMANPYNPLAKWEDGGVDGSIRISAEGQPSVFDMIKVLGGQRNPHDTWARLTETHSEVLGKCENLKFPGPGQRETPVAKDKEAAYYILGLLPGAVGKKYREDAADLVVRIWRGDADC